jgi:PAS domain-containing protein
MTERSKTRSGSNATGGPGKDKDSSNLRGLERRTRVSRRAAPRRKKDSQDSGGDVTPHLSAAAAGDVRQASPANRTDIPGIAASADETVRLRAALDCLPNCLALCDDQLVITFVNRALVNLLGSFQAVIRKRFPGFEARHLNGSALERCHNDPVGLRAQLDACDGLPASISLQMGELSFALICRVLQDADGRRVGTLVEWIEDPRQPPRAG